MIRRYVEQLLFPPVPSMAAGLRPQPEWAVMHQELRRKALGTV